MEKDQQPLRTAPACTRGTAKWLARKTPTQSVDLILGLPLHPAFPRTSGLGREHPCQHRGPRLVANSCPVCGQASSGTRGTRKPARPWGRAAPCPLGPNTPRSVLRALLQLPLSRAVRQLTTPPCEYPFAPNSLFLAHVMVILIGFSEGKNKMHKYRTVFALWKFLFYLPLRSIKFIQPRC